MNLLETSSFSISVVGEKSSETYMGTFHCLRRLSHKAELIKDRYFRELLGTDLEHASERAKSQADIVSDLSVCLVKPFPSWWQESENGLLLVDDGVLREIWENTVRIRLEAIKEVQDKAKAAEIKLKEIAESGSLAK